MRNLIVFNTISLDGYFTDSRNDMSWAHGLPDDAEWNAFVAGNASGGGKLLFGRVTYQMMAGYWPTPMAAQQNPVVAENMNRMAKVVFSRTLAEATWNNTRVLHGDLAAEVRKLKAEEGPGMAILGSGSIVAPLAAAALIDEYQIVVTPIVLGSGRTMFEGVKDRLQLKIMSSRSFRNGKVYLSYQPASSPLP